MKISINDARQLVKTILLKAGFDGPNAHAVMQTIVASEIDGCTAHGLWRTLGCVRTLHNGKVVADARPQVDNLAPGLVRVDAKGGFSVLAFETGWPHLVDKAKTQGIAAMSINHCVHFSALWVEIERLTTAGLVALAFTPSHAWVAPAGGNVPVFGTNPMAFGWPRAAGEPYVFDFATSAVARGEIELHHRECRPIPEGWGVDRQGNSCTDPAEVLDYGAMLTFGSHKGSALSTMIELLAGPLIGDLTSAESLAHDAGSKSSPYHGELLIAVDPARFLGNAAAQHVARAENLFAAVVEQGARLPSQRRYQARKQSLENGLEISDSVYQELLQLT
ncbi:Ldh family oxidoreductase [Erwinia amylovora]|uniref:Malate/L-lactate dehydrogenase family protein n=4 Tax=Erwinia amylovora TaxID=552 RepID=A0A830ZUT4_ERWAM|nr:Ldh family oxidoreductase [Erwinia amylovora]CBX81464.1 malate/L-lactate dehydrogenase family protein [Erwinia amylovora ATCC BAA-2158]CDK15986.1 malate/L-lactate dehydrogenase family protein [Erwinia amylovora LA635]CDK19353.1 malate/L-lactate dehydrogenase family protein [Erwinia amylovora LA636]CDK22724.1 malate/L-lactate dehydrogenase family protein [Erwinia amylovora LA637]ATZ12253.1 oxidoreductase [Erwinia amylovora]